MKSTPSAFGRVVCIYGAFILAGFVAGRYSNSPVVTVSSESEIELVQNQPREEWKPGLVLQIPAAGPKALPFDFASPISIVKTDDRQCFSFNIGFAR